jgi:hypothetical protein
MFEPWIQLSGHAIECAIKAYLCAAGKAVPMDHDLVKLIDSAQSLGLSIQMRGLAMIVNVNHLYSCELRSSTRYRARYPSNRWEPFGGTVPDQEFLMRTVKDLCDQAGVVNDRLNRRDQRKSNKAGSM